MFPSSSVLLLFVLLFGPCVPSSLVFPSILTAGFSALVSAGEQGHGWPALSVLKMCPQGWQPVLLQNFREKGYHNSVHLSVSVPSLLFFVAFIRLIALISIYFTLA